MTRSWRASKCGSAKMSAAVYAVATGHVVRDAAFLDRARVERRGPFGHDAVDRVAVRGAIGQPGEARVVEEIGPVHRLAQPREVGVGAGDDAHVLAVGGRVVVERRGVGEPVAFPVAHVPRRS